MGKFDVEKIFVKLMSTHKMVTRSKKGSSTKKKNIPPSQEFDEDDIDNYGNLKGFIDYDCNEPIDFKDMINTIRGVGKNNIETIVFDDNSEDDDEDYFPKKSKPLQKNKNKALKKKKIRVEEIDELKEVEDIDHDAENAQTNMYLALGLTAITCVLYVIRR